jgi:DNA/RNA endonuclease YhcR with UshA esterase domain
MKKTLLSIFVATFVLSGSLVAQNNISAKEARKHIGEKVNVHGRVSKGELRQTGNKKATVLNIEGGNDLTIVINDDARRNFPNKPEEFYTNKNVTVTGKVVAANGKAEIAISRPEEIKVEQVATGGGQLELKPMDINGITRYFDRDF